MKNRQKGFIVPALLAIIAVLAIGGGVYVYNDKKDAKVEESVVLEAEVQQSDKVQEQVNTQTPVTKTQVDTSSQVNTASWKTYTSVKGKYSFKYPPDWDLAEEDKGVGLQKVTMSKRTMDDYPDYYHYGRVAFFTSLEQTDMASDTNLAGYPKFSAYGFSGVDNSLPGQGENIYASRSLGDGSFLHIGWNIFTTDSDEFPKSIDKKYLLTILSTFKFTN